MLTMARLQFLENQVSTSNDFKELAKFLEVEKNFPEIETTEDRDRIRTLAKKRVQELSKIKNVK